MQNQYDVDKNLHYSHGNCYFHKEAYKTSKTNPKTITKTCKTSKTTLKERKLNFVFNFLLNHTGFIGFTCFCNGFRVGFTGFIHSLTKV